jgi:hypothetical protein
MHNKWLDISLGVTVFLSGLYGGIGFFTVLGGNPTLARLSTSTFAEYWQHIDSFMGRFLFMTGAFVFALLSVWSRKPALN